MFRNVEITKIFTKNCCPKESKGPFKYYVSKEVGGWGQKMTIFADLQPMLT